MLNTRSEKAIAGFVELIDDLRGKLDDELGELVEAVLDRTGYRTRARGVQRPSGSGAAGQPQRIGQRRTRIQHRPGECRGAAETTMCDDEDIPDTGVLAAVPGAGVAGRRRRRNPRARRGCGDDDDAAHRQGPGVPRRVRDGLGGRHVPAHAGARRSDRAVRGTSARLRRHHPGAAAALPEPGQGPVVVGPADAEPGIPVPARDPAGAHRLAARRPARRRCQRPVSGAGRFGTPRPSPRRVRRRASVR